MTQTDYVKKAKPKSNARASKSTNSRTSTRGKKPPARKPAANKSTRARGNAQNTQVAKKPPYIAIALLVITIGAFGYFLWSINGSAEHSTGQNDNLSPPQTQANNTAASKPESKVITTDVKATKTDQQPDIPEPPKEQWQYIDELKTKEVAVEAAKIEQKGPYVMQCATFKDARRAEAFKAQLALLGFESRIKTTQGSNGPRHRVQLGPYEKNRDAQADRHKLSRHKINGCKIWLWTD